MVERGLDEQQDYFTFMTLKQVYELKRRHQLFWQKMFPLFLLLKKFQDPWEQNWEPPSKINKFIFKKNYHVYCHVRIESPVYVRRRMQHAWGWCTVMTQRDVMVREVGGGFMFGNACAPVEDSCQCMAEPIKYCKVK